MSACPFDDFSKKWKNEGGDKNTCPFEDLAKKAVDGKCPVLQPDAYKYEKGVCPFEHLFKKETAENGCPYKGLMEMTKDKCPHFNGNLSTNKKSMSACPFDDFSKKWKNEGGDKNTCPFEDLAKKAVDGKCPVLQPDAYKYEKGVCPFEHLFKK